MRKLLLTAVAASAIAAPAMARDNTPYLGIEAGALFARDLDFDYFDGETSYNNFLVIDHKTGTDLDIVGGYDFGFIRAELELSRKRARHDQYVFDDFEGGTDTTDGDGHTRVISVMGNALADFGNQDRLSFYAGGGLGIAKTKISFDDGVDSGRIRDSHLAWQLIAGVRYAINPAVDIGAKYRYFQTKLADKDILFTGDNADGRFRSHSILASLIFNFAAPAEPAYEAAPPPPAPEPVVEPAPAPAPQTMTCADGTVIAMDAVCPAPPPAPAPGERGQ